MNQSKQNSNGTVFTVTQFKINGAESSLEQFYTELSVSLVIVYLLVITGNLMIILLVAVDRRLHTPMYFFLCHLSFLDIVVVTAIIPKMLAITVMKDDMISFSGCFLQMYFFLGSQCTESFLLTTMAYDRYVAICKPLHYNTIITNRMCAALISITWFLGFFGPVPAVTYAVQLPYCGPNKVIYWFCDFPNVVHLACSDTSFVINLAFASAMAIIYIPFFMILCSYIKIIRSVFRIATADGRRKAFLTCSAHMLVVLTYFFSNAVVYLLEMVGNVSSDTRVLIAVFNCFLTPLANPIIYCLRNKEIKDAIRKYILLKKIVPSDSNT
ncbi:olfactory receptor 6N1-like [Huso huso]|uniref:Olfactory receptor n=1 Tax=Huso huso TaxID=61971 RepID=A0ABR0Y1F4_HUSHU